MGTVRGPKSAPEYVPGKSSTVTGITEAQIYAVAFVNAEGRKSMCLTLVFGKDTEDEGQPGVYILADEDRMRENLAIANPYVKKGVREHIARQREVSGAEVPDDAMSVDLGSGGETK
jgi:hypothetical protein